jgi:hypothetical protein
MFQNKRRRYKEIIDYLHKQPENSVATIYHDCAGNTIINLNDGLMNSNILNIKGDKI